jgi:hypothetical protein
VRQREYDKLEQVGAQRDCIAADEKVEVDVVVVDILVEIVTAIKEKRGSSK